MADDIRCDVAIVGGGLAGGLLAYALAVRRPDLRLRLIDADPRLGGNHIWSFFSNDIAPEHRWIVEPFVSRSWNGYSVHFPTHDRELGLQYNSIRSERFDRVLRETLPADSILTAQVSQLRANGVALADFRLVRAMGVIDARGSADLSRFDCGWQKFLGQELELAAPHGLEHPIVMDATVEQHEGYRFVYCLPFTPDRVFVEDTYYADRPQIDHAALSQRIADYAAMRGWRVARIAREEQGALPVVIGGDFEGYRRSGGGGVAKIGVRAGLFHPVTGYSLPDAVRVAGMIAGMDDFSGLALRRAMRDHARRVWEDRGFYRMLNAMLFRAADEHGRYRVFERFYRLSPALIARFFAAGSTTTDKLRILAGRPPVPVGRALKVVREHLT